MKKRIGIITMHRLYNYGSALQAYALQRVIEEMGIEAEIIDYNYPNSFQYERGIRPPTNNWKTKVIRLMWKIHPHNRVRYKFHDFWNKHFTLSNYFPDFITIHNNSLSYALCVTGSDQVWNPQFTKGDTTFLLDFIDRNIPKISYASSFSTTNLDNAYRPLFAKLLSQYKAISVREKGGVEIVKELTGKNAKITVDPTLLLSASEWIRLTEEHKCPQNNGGKYLLLYVLSYAFNPSPYIYDFAFSVSKRLDLPIVAIGGKDPSVKESSLIHWIDDAGPIEFIKLFANSTVVVTSSFHGTAFATNFKKKVFTVIKSNSTDDRISSFLNSIGLNKAIVPMGTPFEEVSIDEDTTIAQQLLEKRKDESMKYLRNAIIDNL